MKNINFIAIDLETATQKDICQLDIVIVNCTPKVRQKLLKCSFIMRHSFETKLNIVSKIRGGYPLNRLYVKDKIQTII
ncbi:unknown [Tannerella sp. CAG:118]|nr:unknown [Tannerella sp. CAG:118]